MRSVKIKERARKFSYYSSLKHDVWGGDKGGRDHEWWYFDALSDNGREAVVISFVDDCRHSSIYGPATHVEPGPLRLFGSPRVPAIGFTYCVDGKPVYQTIVQYSAADFEASTEKPACRIGPNSFTHASSPYGTGFAIHLDIELPRRKMLKASFEWLSIESNLTPETDKLEKEHFWNLVAPRSDVTGKIEITDRVGKQKIINFRGTGYHDRNSFRSWMPNKITDWFWGRSHFALATAVYFRFRKTKNDTETTRLLLIREGRIDSYEASFSIGKTTTRFNNGLSYPESIRVQTDGISLEVATESLIDSSPFYVRSLSSMSLTENGSTDESRGISEYLSPSRMQKWWLVRLLRRWSNGPGR